MQVENPLIEVKDISFAYNGNTVLEHVSFNVEQGDYVGIVGPNGGGKTTLLKLLVGLIPPQTGSIKIAGVPIEQFQNKFQIGYVPQRSGQENVTFPATVYEVVESGVTAKTGWFNRPTDQDKQAVKKALAIAQIEELKDKLIGQLSGGQRQRVYVARALAAEPKILILDEPFVGIDVAAQKNFYAFLKQLNQEQNLTIVFVSHDIDMITEEVKSILCLNRGLFCLDKPELLHEGNTLENLYGKKITHIHHSH
jgi:zinc transport system ATP-binding protein